MLKRSEIAWESRCERERGQKEAKNRQMACHWIKTHGRFHASLQIFMAQKLAADVVPSNSGAHAGIRHPSPPIHNRIV